ncbi:MAG: AbiV family abortive infection protein [Burkholderiales bacterium]
MSIKFWVLDLYAACLSNASDLLEEAELLAQHGRAPRAYFLAYTAMEELGKSQVVADYFNDLVAEAEFEAAFRNHVFKAAYINRYVPIPKDLDQQWFIEYDKAAVKRHVTDRGRALYIECKPNNTPQLPKEEISKASANEMIASARKYLEAIRRMEYLTERIGTKAFTK